MSGCPTCGYGPPYIHLSEDRHIAHLEADNARLTAERDIGWAQEEKLRAERDRLRAATFAWHTEQHVVPWLGCPHHLCQLAQPSDAEREK